MFIFLIIIIIIETIYCEDVLWYLKGRSLNVFIFYGRYKIEFVLDSQSIDVSCKTIIFTLKECRSEVLVYDVLGNRPQTCYLMANAHNGIWCRSGV